MMNAREKFVTALMGQYGEIVSKRLFRHSLRDAPDGEHFAVEYSKVVCGGPIPVASLILSLVPNDGVA
jgi:hypothetical protein